jgi:2'-5' RNA ligase
LFVAAYPPADAIDDLATLVDRMAVGRSAEPGQSRRLAPPSRWHLTLAFLGDLPDSRLEATTDALGRASRYASEPPRLRLSGGGRFGRGRFTVLWVGIAGDVDAVRAIAAAVRGELKRAGLPFDPKPFRPHLTLARPSDRLGPDELAADLDALDRYRGPEWVIEELVLVRSQLGPRPRHEPIGTWRIGVAD